MAIRESKSTKRKKKYIYRYIDRKKIVNMKEN